MLEAGGTLLVSLNNPHSLLMTNGEWSFLPLNSLLALGICFSFAIHINSLKSEETKLSHTPETKSEPQVFLSVNGLQYDKSHASCKMIFFTYSKTCSGRLAFDNPSTISQCLIYIQWETTFWGTTFDGICCGLPKQVLLYKVVSWQSVYEGLNISALISHSAIVTCYRKLQSGWCISDNFHAKCWNVFYVVYRFTVVFRSLIFIRNFQGRVSHL